MKKVLTIAGSDCSGGAGIQADLKTMAAHGVYGMSVITALTAQNTQGVTAIVDCTPDFVAAQLDSVFTDIVPDAVKIGMVSRADIIAVIADKLVQYDAHNIVVDPVMVSTSGCKLIGDDAQQTLVDRLFPLATVITPNLAEAQALCGFAIGGALDAIAAAQAIAPTTGGGVLIKGGHSAGDASDLLYHEGQNQWFSARRIENPNTHGTGCTLSSAIACQLALGNPLAESVRLAKAYLTGAIGAQLDLGKGRGPLHHMYQLS